MSRKLKTLAAALGAAGLCLGAVQAQAQDKVKIGFITDMSSLYADVDGKNGAMAIQMAIDDFGGKVLGKPIELVSADHQNKADIAASKAREWIDTQGLTMLFGGTNSGTALAMAKIADEKKRVFMVNGAGSSALTNDQCTPYTVHYAYDTVALAKGTAGALVKQGNKDWFFLTADYAFGAALEADTAKVVKDSGGRVLGSVRHPLNASDFSSFILQAQNSKAQVIGLANGAQDTVNAIKAAREFGIGSGKGQKVASLLMFLTDVHSLGLKQAQGLMFSEGFYWDMDDKTRAFSTRFEKLHKGFKPTMVQAGVYSSVRHYLKSVAAAKTDDWKTVAQKMRELPIDDPVMRNASIRPDGRVIHDMYLFQVKAPSESKGPWDYYKTVSTIPAQTAFKPLAQSACPLVKK